MACTNPIIAIKTGKTPEGKNLLYFPNGFRTVKNFELGYKEYCQAHGKENVLLLPCGHCLSCKITYSRTWAYRCLLEASLYEDNCFLTLTFDDDHLPADGHVHKRDLQLFLKRLRKEYGEGIRFFGCGEYGDTTHRPHYHVILFNFWPKDTYLNPATGFKTLTSYKLAELWPYGHHTVGDCTLASCSYVARYCTKKIFNKDDDSFLLMSRRPGLGYDYFMKHYENIYKYDLIYTAEGNSKPSRYFDILMSKINPDVLENVKDLRLSKSSEILNSVLNSRSLFSFEDNCNYVNKLTYEKFKNLKKTKM